MKSEEFLAVQATKGRAAAAPWSASVSPAKSELDRNYHNYYNSSPLPPPLGEVGKGYERDTTLSRHLSWQGGALCILMTQIAQVEATVILHPTMNVGRYWHRLRR